MTGAAMLTAGRLNLDRDERKELYILLGRLDKRQRLKFLNWACSRVSRGHLHTKVTSSSGESLDVWGDLINLAGVHGLDLREATNKLAEIVRRKG